MLWKLGNEGDHITLTKVVGPAGMEPGNETVISCEFQSLITIKFQIEEIFTSMWHIKNVSFGFEKATSVAARLYTHCNIPASVMISLLEDNWSSKNEYTFDSMKQISLVPRPIWKEKNGLSNETRNK